MKQRILSVLRFIAVKFVSGPRPPLPAVNFGLGIK